MFILFLFFSIGNIVAVPQRKKCIYSSTKIQRTNSIKWRLSENCVKREFNFKLKTVTHVLLTNLMAWNSFLQTEEEIQKLEMNERTKRMNERKWNEEIKKKQRRNMFWWKTAKCKIKIASNRKKTSYMLHKNIVLFILMQWIGALEFVSTRCKNKKKTSKWRKSFKHWIDKNWNDGTNVKNKQLHH